MKVFIGWSGTRSHEIAQAFYKWLPRVIQAVDPFISSGIPKGKHWGEAIADELEKTKVGILCLTRENLNANWILFEAGALSKTKGAYVCTFLLDIEHANLEQPLASFQYTTFKKNDIRDLMYTVNDALNLSDGISVEKDILDDTFDLRWPELEKKLNKILENLEDEDKPIRSERDILEEIITILRAERTLGITQRMPTYMVPEPRVPGSTDRKRRGLQAKGTPGNRD